jgi:hypothetical protein
MVIGTRIIEAMKGNLLVHGRLPEANIQVVTLAVQTMQWTQEVRIR